MHTHVEQYCVVCTYIPVAMMMAMLARHITHPHAGPANIEEHI